MLYTPTLWDISNVSGISWKKCIMVSLYVITSIDKTMQIVVVFLP
jgi:hypothetical protein